MAVSERKRAVTLDGAPVLLLGVEIGERDHAPDFRAVDGSFKPVRLSDFEGRICLISAVPSLDTSVCATQTKRFNEEVERLPDDVAMITISMDLPFAQKRFCEAERVDSIQVLSDHVWRDFGLGYGVLIKDMGLLARSVFVIGKDGRIVHAQIVPEISEQPDYNAALNAVRAEIDR